MFQLLAAALPSIIGLGSAVAPTALSIANQQDVNKQNKTFAREQMDFQERMSNTAHQREIADLKKAGLNPILSSKYGGSSTPTGSMATMLNPMGDSTQNLTSTAQTLLNTTRLKNEIATMKTQQTLNQSTAQKQFQDARIQKEYADYRESPLGRSMIPISDIMGSARQLSDTISNFIPRPKINVIPKF